MATLQENLTVWAALHSKMALDGPQVMTDEDIKTMATTSIALVPQFSGELLAMSELVKDYENCLFKILDIILASGNKELHFEALKTIFKDMLSPIIGKIYEN